MNKPVKHRLFFGLEIPESVKQQLLSIQQPVAGARWQGMDQLHLTLVFLGSIEEEYLPAVRGAARHLPLKPFELIVSGIGCFGRPERPKNLWAGVQPVAELTDLHEALNHRLAQSGFAREQRQFRPHITLARFKKKEAGSAADFLQAHGELHIEPFQVDHFVLFESVQAEHGSVYHVVERFPLSGAG